MIVDKPMQPAATATLVTAAASSVNTTLTQGSLPWTTKVIKNELFKVYI